MHTRLRRLVVAVLMVALGVLSTSCSSSDTEPENITGTYTLTSINGVSVPTPFTYTFFDGSSVATDSSTFVSGSMQLNADMTFQQSYRTRDRIFQGTVAVDDETTDDPSSGTFTRSGNNLTFNSVASSHDAARTDQGSISGKSLTFTAVVAVPTSPTQTTNLTIVAVFTKQ